MSSSATKPSKETRLAPEPLTTCPKCTYALTGLPSAHRCPECGFEFDEYSWAWLAPAKKWPRFHFVILIMLWLANFMWCTRLFYQWTSVSSYPVFILFSMLLMAIGILVFIFKLFLLNHHPMLVVTEQGLTVRKDFRPLLSRLPTRTYAWSSIISFKNGSGLLRSYMWVNVNSGYWFQIGRYARNEAEREALKNSLTDARVHYLCLIPTPDK